MSKKINLKEEISKYLSENSESSPTDVSEFLSKKLGVKVRTAYVSTVKSQMRKKSQKKYTSSAVSTRKDPVVSGAVDQLFQAKEFAAACGSIENAKLILSQYESIVK